MLKVRTTIIIINNQQQNGQRPASSNWPVCEQTWRNRRSQRSPPSSRWTWPQRVWQAVCPSAVLVPTPPPSRKLNCHNGEYGVQLTGRANRAQVGHNSYGQDTNSIKRALYPHTDKHIRECDCPRWQVDDVHCDGHCVCSDITMAN